MNSHRPTLRRFVAAVVLSALLSAATAQALTFTQTVNMNGNPITNVATPTSGSPSSQAATKGYVDIVSHNMGGGGCTRYVCAAAPTGGDGSLALPWDSLYALTNNSGGVLNNTTVIVLPGTYYTDSEIAFGPGYTNLTVTGLDAVNTRVISLNNNTRIFNVQDVSGVTIQCLALTSTNNSGHGGAVFLGNGGIVRECLFVECSTSAGGNCGGAVFAHGTALVERCQFTRNSAAQAGALYLEAHGARADQCVFVQNSSTVMGGAIVCQTNCIVRQSRFENNSSGFNGGAVIMWQGGTLQDSEFTGNAAFTGGSAVYCNWGGTIRNCSIIRGDGALNSVTSFGSGSKWMSVWTNSLNDNCYVVYATDLNN